jgi:hypothetical protein
MTIQRQYSLPNCTLVLEGMGDTLTVSPSSGRPPLSMLFNAECYFSGLEKPLTGGRDFLESLVTAVSQYAQEVLSGMSGQRSQPGEATMVQLQRLNADRHRLVVKPPGTPAEVELNTVQLFDLVEAVDQMLADTQTLPDLALKLRPLSRRQVTRTEPATRQILPAAIGASSLAVAAAALFAIPTPQIKEPETLYPRPGATSTTAPSSSTSPQAGASPGSSPKPTVSPGASPSTSPDVSQLETILTATSEIKDSQDVAKLGESLREKIAQKWTKSPISKDLVYRLGVNRQGAIIGYKPVNPDAAINARETPLLDLLDLKAASAHNPTEPIAQYKVVFTPSGNLDVSPWGEVAASVQNKGPEITDSAAIKTLQPKLYDQIDKAWKEKPVFKESLTFRVRVSSNGSILSYRPEGKAAIDYGTGTPLPNLGSLEAEGNVPPKGNFALFKVVFKPDGKLEVSPWRGQQP